MARTTKKSSKTSRKKTEEVPRSSINEVIALITLGISLLVFLALVSYTPDDLYSWVPFSSQDTPNDPAENFVGRFGAVSAGFTYWLIGAAAYLIPTAFVWFGVFRILTGRTATMRMCIGFMLFLVSGACLIQFQTLFLQDWESIYNIPGPGGGIGAAIGDTVLGTVFGRVGSFVVMSIAYLVSLVMLTGFHPLHFFKLVKDAVFNYRERKEEKLMETADERGKLELEQKRLERKHKKLQKELAKAGLPVPEVKAAKAPAKSSTTSKNSAKSKSTPKAEAPAKAELEEEALEEEATWKSYGQAADDGCADSEDELRAAAVEVGLDPDDGDLYESWADLGVALDTMNDEDEEEADEDEGEDVTAEDVEPANPEPKIIDASVRRPQFTRGQKKTLGNSESQVATIGGLAFEGYELPHLDLLDFDEADEAAPADQGELLGIQNTIIETLGTFGISVSAGDITRGPTITRYEIYPGKGLRVNRITALEADLARATKAERINIIAPIPGKDTVGIEIANKDKVIVPLRELLEDPKFQRGKAKIPIALGKDVYGNTIIADLGAMPHLLVAGATGSGKSVCINSILASLLFQFSPDELRLILIDPKVVEMQIYNSLPHLVIPVVTDPKKVLLALRWVVNEMERRYHMFAKVNARNFEGFNSIQKKKREQEQAECEEREAAEALEDAEAEAEYQEEIEASGSEVDHAVSDGAEEIGAEEIGAGEGLEFADAAEEREGAEELVTHAVKLGQDTQFEPAAIEEEEEEEVIPDRIPYIVVIIDELADLMQTAPADVEVAIARITQKARAAGIHLIVATQTPRADVVTGVIKANIPSRIAFQVSSKLDSRVILDEGGAERLVGKGDMLYLPPGTSQLARAQGAMVSDEEIQSIVEFASEQTDQKFETGIQKTLETGGEGEEEDVSPEDEEILEKCVEVIIQEKRASTSLLQRRLRLGYTRAARMIDILEGRGLIGPGDGAKPREILMSLEPMEYEMDE